MKIRVNQEWDDDENQRIEPIVKPAKLPPLENKGKKKVTKKQEGRESRVRNPTFMEVDDSFDYHYDGRK